MVNIWQRIRNPVFRGYDLSRLIDVRQREDFSRPNQRRQIICDIDKTYLETEFESLYRVARIAFEGASSKRTVRGASEVLLAARWGFLNRPEANLGAPPQALHFVSSSPPQLRNVLEEKLLLDGLDWSSDTFKNQAYNLMRGRVDLLRHHVAYKSAAILRILQKAGPEASFVLIGDNAESDAYVYTGIYFFTRQRLNAAGYQLYLELAGVDPVSAKNLTDVFASAMLARVDGTLIRNAPGYNFVTAPPLTDYVQTFDNYFQAAISLTAWGLIAPQNLWHLARNFHNRYGLSRREILACLDSLKERQNSVPDLAPLLENIMQRFAGAGPIPKGQSGMKFNLVAAGEPDTHRSLDQNSIIKHAATWISNMHEERNRRSARK